MEIWGSTAMVLSLLDKYELTKYIIYTLLWDISKNTAYLEIGLVHACPSSILETDTTFWTS